MIYVKSFTLPSIVSASFPVIRRKNIILSCHIAPISLESSKEIIKNLEVAEFYIQ